MHERIRFAAVGWVIVLMVAPIASAYAEIEEIVVTSRKTEERLQDVPIAITVLGAQQIQEARIESFDDVASITPGLNFFNPVGGSLPTPVIRGVAPTDIFGETNAAIFVDGVYAAGREGLNFAMLDVARIEVVKGPQSALYGRNAFSGAINYITKRPSNEFSSTVEVTAGNRGRTGLKGNLSGPLIGDSLRASIGAGYDTWDGSYDNPVSDVDVGGYEYKTFTAALDWTPTDTFSALLNVYYSDDHLDDPAITAQLANCENTGTNTGANSRLSNLCGEVADLDEIRKLYNENILGNPNIPTELQFKTGSEEIASIAGATGNQREVTRVSLNMDWDVAGGTLSALTGYSYLSHEAKLDGTDGLGYTQPFVYCEQVVDYADPLEGTVPLCLDSGALPSLDPSRFTTGEFVVSPEETTEEISQEIRFAGPQDGAVRYSFGGYAFKSVGRNVGAYLLGSAPSLPAGLEDITGSSLPPGVAGPNPPLPGAAFGPYLDNSLWAIGDGAFRTWFTPTSTFGWDTIGKDETTSYAGFGTLDWDITDQLTADFQARYTDEKKSVELTAPLLPVDQRYPSNSKHFKSVTGKAGLTFTFNDDWMIYSSISNGSKAGGFDVEEVQVIIPGGGSEERVIIAPFDEEKILAFELGAKGSMADGRVRLDLAIYRMNWDDIVVPQLFSVDPTTGEPLEQPEGFNTNAGDATVNGFEAQGDISFTDNWFSGFGVSFTDSTMDSGKLESFADLPSFAPDGDVAGNDVLRQPKWQANANVRYIREVGANWEFSTRADITYQDKYFGGLDNQWTIPSHTYVNLRLGLESERMVISLWAKNIFNNNSPISAYRNVYFGNTDDIFQQLPASSSPQKFFPWRISSTHPKLRTFGLTLNVKFGGAQ